MTVQLIAHFNLTRFPLGIEWPLVSGHSWVAKKRLQEVCRGSRNAIKGRGERAWPHRETHERR